MGEDAHLRPVEMPVRRPVHLFQLSIVADILPPDPAHEEKL
jgi:hypothetical protein